jgi:plastocyanin
MRTGVAGRARVVVASAALVVLATCGGDDGDTDEADTGATTASAGPASSAATTLPGSAPPGTARPTTTVAAASIGVRDFTFQPATVAPGVVVRLANADSSEHTVESPDGAWTWDPASQTFTAPATAGNYAVFCAIHTSMTGTLTVA